MSVENCQATKTWDLGLGIWDLGNGKWEKRVPPVPGDDSKISEASLRFGTGA